jgi:hypothetical protein
MQSATKGESADFWFVTEQCKCRFLDFPFAPLRVAQNDSIVVTQSLLAKSKRRMIGKDTTTQILYGRR